MMTVARSQEAMAGPTQPASSRQDHRRKSNDQIYYDDYYYCRDIPFNLIDSTVQYCIIIIYNICKSRLELNCLCWVLVYDDYVKFSLFLVDIRCFPVLLGGSQVTMGHSDASAQR